MSAGHKSLLRSTLALGNTSFSEPTSPSECGGGQTSGEHEASLIAASPEAGSK
jgi:hypothetical protein